MKDPLPPAEESLGDIRGCFNDPYLSLPRPQCHTHTHTHSISYLVFTHFIIKDLTHFVLDLWPGLWPSGPGSGPVVRAVTQWSGLWTCGPGYDPEPMPLPQYTWLFYLSAHLLSAWWRPAADPARTMHTCGPLCNYLFKWGGGGGFSSRPPGGTSSSFTRSLSRWTGSG